MASTPFPATLLLVLLLAPARGFADAKNARYAADSAGLLWFLQISDLHIGEDWINPKWPPEHLQFALEDAATVVGPSFIVASGDLCDGSKNGIPTAGQDQGEWDQYKRIYMDAGMDPDFYFDVVGNHDMYGGGPEYYLANSLQGRTAGAAHFGWTRTTPLGEYFFYALNTVGATMPAFSNGSEITDDEFNALQAALDAHAGARLQIVFGHHRPTQGKNAARLVQLLGDRGAYYLHGHVHEYDQYLENGKLVVLEVDSLGKSESNNLAIAAIDHDALVYRPTSIKKPWPLVVITAPVDRKLKNGEENPYAYPVCKNRHDNPIRALVFAPTAPTAVTAQVGTLVAEPMERDPSVANLWTTVVDTAPLAAGDYPVKVLATVAGETVEHTITVPFVTGTCDPWPDLLPPPDLGTSPDLAEEGDGGRPVGAATAGGCDCRVAGPPAPGPALLALLVLFLLRRPPGVSRPRRSRRP